MKTKFKIAFETWLCITFQKDVTDIANYLFKMVKSGCPSDSMIWDMLDETGDKQYNFETFLKVARNVVAE